MSFQAVIRGDMNATFCILPVVSYKTRSEAQTRSLRAFSAYVLSGSYRYYRGDKLVIVEINDDDQNSQQVVSQFDPRRQVWCDPG